MTPMSTATESAGSPGIPQPYGVLLPVYNEAARLAPVLERIRVVLPDAEIVVIDDGSRDDSVAVARAAGATVLELPINLGYGAALQTGYRYGVQRGWKAAIQMDGDGQHEPEDAPALLQAVADGSADVVVGSRFLNGETYPIGPVRRAAMRWFAWIATNAIGSPVTDPTSGYQALSRDALRFYCSDFYPTDFPDADVLILVNRAGLRTAERPVRMYAAPGKPGLHAGFAALYYMFKMTLSIVVTLLRSVAPESRFRG